MSPRVCRFPQPEVCARRLILILLTILRAAQGCLRQQRRIFLRHRSCTDLRQISTNTQHLQSPLTFLLFKVLGFHLIIQNVGHPDTHFEFDLHLHFVKNRFRERHKQQARAFAEYQAALNPEWRQGGANSYQVPQIPSVGPAYEAAAHFQPSYQPPPAYQPHPQQIPETEVRYQQNVYQQPTVQQPVQNMQSVHHAHIFIWRIILFCDLICRK